MNPETLLSLSLATLLLPLASFVILIFFSRRFPRQGDWLGTAIAFTALATALAIAITKLTAFHDEVIQANLPWVDFGNVPGVGPLTIQLGIMVDNLSAIMLVVVMIVSSLVHLFSIGYMQGDVRYGRYFAYLGIFTFSMLGIVLTNNFFMMYVSWELVGLSSYLLIGHWFEKRSASDAAKKAFIVNRVGDVGMFIGILILYATYHTFTFDPIFAAIRAGQIPMGSEAWLTAAGILVFCGAVGKSAQFPLHVWLPDAMEGPTPVSALIHAATMVAAGVYLVTRTFAMLTADALMFIAYIGAATAFIAATIAIAQNDIKKVLAYSTVSQLGYMVMGLGVGAYTAGFFHLSTHAMFKAGLFLGSGSVIHAMHHALHHAHDHHTDPQDIRNMGGLRTKMPVTFWTFLIYTLAISGIPLTSGFLSKDEILAGTLAFGDLTGHAIIPIVAFFVAGLTAFYMFRLVILTFFGKPADEHRLAAIHESPKVMTVPLIVFAALSVFAVWTGSFNPFSAEGWFTEAMPRPETVVPASAAAATNEVWAETSHHVHGPAMVLSLIMASTGIVLAFVVFYWKRINADAVVARLKPLHTFLVNKWYFDELYDATVINGTLAVTRAYRWFDETVVDGIVNGVARWTMGVTLGKNDAWEGGTFGSIAYLLVTGLVSVYAGWVLASSLAPADPTFGQLLWYGLLGLGTAGLSFFMFYVGVGGFDNTIVDGLVNLVATFAGFTGIVTRRIQTGKVQTYLAFVLLGVMVFFLWFN
ncbi:MAG: NADH-quinone oxidoreductase subunit L [Bacteroidetes bacterium]|jgi:NADH-quinone oxidoreductase subunit L|nr:NADH-quinone oxidoreductase subunit L [Bacteroidota bacterium]